ncbi:hypothetical protein [Streptomyces sp. DSM 40750]|uniref:hypothetical protein n=1 Tax=Streptomyces sp. DSM 40750 TaxID=2801030 RepID=UPI00214B0003|nr:hypothetical protein [Streptomyces sp. DSM 40750]UUU22932.1 hypothetical protein JIX55_23025 [Streptomyces sp. DSM 40750]
MSIIHALLRWVLGAFAPGTGRRRAGTRLDEPDPAYKPDASPTATTRPPAPRSPYSLDTDSPLDGAVSPLVRPYLVAAEREQARQSRRRLALVLAADFGIDLDCHVVGADGVVAC